MDGPVSELVNLRLNTYLLSSVFRSFGNGIRSQVSFSIMESYSFLMAYFHWSLSGPCMAASYVMGSGLS